MSWAEGALSNIRQVPYTMREKIGPFGAIWVRGIMAQVSVRILGFMG